MSTLAAMSDLLHSAIAMLKYPKGQWQLQRIVHKCVKLAYGQCAADGAKPLTVVASGLPQYFSSPNYPNNFPGNDDCAWIVNAPSAGEKVIINIQDVGLDTGDTISVYDGDSNGGTQLATRTFTDGDDLHEFVSSNTSLYVELVTNFLFDDTGFQALYFVADSAIFQPCSQTLNATLTTQYLSSRNLPDPYASGYNCTTYIQAADELFTLRFRLYFLDVEVTTGCTSDKFEILQGVSVDSLTSTLTSICTTASVYSFSDIDSIFSVASVTLLADNANDDYYGFLMTYEEVYQGINVTYPAEDDIVQLNATETDTGDIDQNIARIHVTTTGGAGMNFVVLQDGNVTSLFQFNTAGTPADTYYLAIASTLDYETDTFHYLTVIMADNTYPSLTATVFFNVTVTDVDDNAPVFTNLPGNVTVYRSAATGFSVFTVSSTDNDTTPAFQVTTYAIDSGDTDNLLAINNTTGEITLTQNIAILAITVTSYTVDIRATSNSSGLFTTATLELIVPPDSPPICTHTTAWGDELNENLVITGTVIEFSDPWNCTDENVTTYSIASVSPTLSTQLFSISSTTGEITMLRPFSVTEVPSRQFQLTVDVVDNINQTTTFAIKINVTALICLPNPFPIYVRMDAVAGAVIASDYNCTGANLQYTLTSQAPAGIFGLSGSELTVQASVFKNRFYSLSMDIFDGVDTVSMVFRVTVRMRQCNNFLANTASTTQHHTMTGILLVIMNIFKWFTFI